MKLVDQVRCIVETSKQKTANFLEQEYDSFLEEARKEVYRQIVESAQQQYEVTYFNFHPNHRDFMEIKNNYHIFALNKYEICQKLHRDIVRYLENEGFQVEIDRDDNYEIRVSWEE